MADSQRIALGLEYDGRCFEGWQTQPHGRTVQDVVEAAIARVAAEAVGVVCAGRTDSGVHATAQVIHFETASRRPLSAWVRGVNSALPAAVAVTWARVVDGGFHARFSAEQRHYRYILLNRGERPGLLSGRVGWFHRPLDVACMATAAACLLGEHDFSSFRASACQAHSPVRTMSVARVAREGDFVCFDFSANAFLHHMIRNIVGALVYAGKEDRGAEWMAGLLAARRRTDAPPTFSADGLYLCGASYPPKWSLPGDGRIICRPQLSLCRDIATHPSQDLRPDPRG